MHVLRFVVIALALVLATATPALAQPSDADKATARQLAIDAQKELKAENFDKAADLFQRAEDLFHAPTLLVGLARAHAGAERYVQAIEAYNKVIREKLDDKATDAFKTAVKDAKAEIEPLKGKISWITIRIEGPDAPVATLDDQPLAVASLGVKRAIDPGDHVLKVSAEGFEPGDKSFSITSGDSDEISLTLKAIPGGGNPPPATDDDPGALQRTLGFVGLGLGGAGLILGGVTGGLAVGAHGDLSDNCPENRCPADQEDTLNNFETMGTLSTVGFIAGGVFAATGLVLILTAPSGDAEGAADEAPAARGVDVRATVGLGSVHATVSF